MNQLLSENISTFNYKDQISNERKNVLEPLIQYIQQKVNNGLDINLNFICTHNSRRSHLSQVWAQVASSYFNIKNVNTYSAGTEETAVFPKIIEILINTGFSINKISEGQNPIYAIKYDVNKPAIIAFSKQLDHSFNPSSNFAAIMTCSQADEGCPFIAGAEKRIPITYEDPKISDNTEFQNEIYAQRSKEIATEMFYVFSNIKV